MDTFKCDDCLVITIPMVNGDRGQSETLKPEKFHCVVKDSYKVFRKGQLQALGTAQIVTGLLAITLFLEQTDRVPHMLYYAMPGILTKTSFTLNIINLFCALTVLGFWIWHICWRWPPWYFNDEKGIDVIIAIQLSLQVVVTIVLIYWENKAV